MIYLCALTKPWQLANCIITYCLCTELFRGQGLKQVHIPAQEAIVPELPSNEQQSPNHPSLTETVHQKNPNELEGIF